MLSIMLMERQEISEIKYDSNGIEKKSITSPSSDPVILGDFTPLYNVTIGSENWQEISETKDIEKKSTTLPSSDTVTSRGLTSRHNVTIESEKRQEISETKDNPSSSDIEKKKIITLPSSDLVISRDLTSLNNVTTESERVGVITENIQVAKELYLESLYQKPPTQGFYCPNCRTCIEKVLILDSVRQEPDAPPPPPTTTTAQPLSLFERFICSTCFSFLIPTGSWVIPWWARDKEETKVPAPAQVPPDSRGQKLQPEPTITDDTPKTQDPSYQEAIEIPEAEPGPDGSRAKPSRWGVLDSASAVAIQKKPQVDIPKVPEQQQPVEEFVSAGASTDPPFQAIEIPEEKQGADVSTAKPSRWRLLASASAIAIPEKPQEEISKVPEQRKPVEEGVLDGERTEPTGSTASATATTTGAVQEAGSSKTWDILKSIVYGGLVESIASLGIVASSASADATTLSILALSLANLIGGLFILVHHIWDLKSEEQSTNEIVDRYYLSLGKRDNFYLHVCIAILSFLIFGLVPPLVYGLTFYMTNDKDLTLVAVAGASVICITLLSIAKVYIQSPNTYLTYLKTVLYYLCTGALTSVIAYLVGVLIRQLLEKLGLSSESSLSFNLMLPQVSVIEKPRFGSY